MVQILFSLMLSYSLASLNPPPHFINAAFYQSWSQFNEEIGGRKAFQPEMIDPELITDLYYAFAVFGFIADPDDPTIAGLTHDFKIYPLYKNEKNDLYPQLQELKKRSRGKLRLILSIGGANFNQPNDLYGMGKKTYRLFSQMVSTRSNRKEFIDSAILYAHQYGFDGVDIDWEYPGDRETGGQESDFKNFPLFLEECAHAFRLAKPPLLLSYSAPATIPKGVPKEYHDHPETYYQWLAKCAKSLDRINIMAYDYHTPFTDFKFTGANAPLRKDTFPSSSLFITHTLDNYLSYGVPADKILLGIPVYGWVYDGISNFSQIKGPGSPFMRAGNPALLSYFEIADLIFSKKFSLNFDPETETAYAYSTEKGQWISFDTPSTTKQKVNEAKKRGLAGVIFWSIDQDEYQWEPKFPNIRVSLDP
ncbi:MAG: glycoside hydrolase family 18 protein [Waddliaceae bacterium]